LNHPALAAYNALAMGNPLDAIAERVKRFIVSPSPGGFEPLALEVFAFQFQRNLPYRNYCLRKDKTPDTVSRWSEIPAVPTGAFKELELTSLEPGKKPEAIFRTSGTTQGSGKPGRHLVADLSVYEAAILPNFADHLLPDKARLRMMILTGSPWLWPQSSLAYMMEAVRKAHGTEHSSYYIHDRGLNLESLIADLQTAESVGESVFLLGITPAIFELIDRVRSLGIKFSLPPGSRIMDTGGFKGRRTEISKGELYGLYREALGIPEEFIVNEYGMTEMSSQFYDNVLANHFRDRHEPRYKSVPPWVRTTVVDPETLEEAPRGTVGLLKHLDLANCGSVMALLTEDLGYATGNGFVLAGRVQGAEARGCSLLIEELVKQRTV
jgi:hypothetical protein